MSSKRREPGELTLGQVLVRREDRNRQLARDLHGATTRGEIAAVFQPLVAVDTGQVVAAEALSRWLHPTLGVILPAEFIPVAEDSGQITELGDRMIELGCAAAADWQRLAPGIGVSINVSALQLRDVGFAHRLLQSAESHSLDPVLITVEVTESKAIEDVEAAVERLTVLGNLGIGISIDDFGTGHSSKEQVSALPATELKIDQSLVRDDSPEGLSRLRGAVKFGQDLDLRIVAEGVETSAQLQRVRDLGCDRAQGYLLGQPMPEKELAQLVAAS